MYRAVARSENPGGHVVLGGDNVPPLVEIGLADLPKSGGARAPLAPPLATGLYLRVALLFFWFSFRPESKQSVNTVNVFINDYASRFVIWAITTAA